VAGGGNNASRGYDVEKKKKKKKIEGKKERWVSTRKNRRSKQRAGPKQFEAARGDASKGGEGGGIEGEAAGTKKKNGWVCWFAGSEKQYRWTL